MLKSFDSIHDITKEKKSGKWNNKVTDTQSDQRSYNC